MTDAPDNDDSDAAEYDDADYPNDTENDSGSPDSKKSPYSLRKLNKYFKNTHNT